MLTYTYSMNINIDIKLNPDNAQHVALAQWVDKHRATDDITNALLCGFYIVSNPDLISYKCPHETLTSIKQQYDQRVAHLKAQHAEDIEIYRKRLNEQCDQWIQKYDTLMQNYNNHIKSEITNMQAKEIENLKAQLNVFQNTNSYKGQMGEKRIQDILHEHFIGYEIKDTSGQTNKADIHVINSNNDIVAIESKNKATITTQDVAKCLKDIKTT